MEMENWTMHAVLQSMTDVGWFFQQKDVPILGVLPGVLLRNVQHYGVLFLAYLSQSEFGIYQLPKIGYHTIPYHTKSYEQSKFTSSLFLMVMIESG